jgi:hypothetical protein
MKKMINTVEDAYELMGQIILRNAHSSEWHSLIIDAPILSTGCGGVVTVQRDQSGKDTDLHVAFDVFEIQQAALFLRDELLRTTGDRIWGLTFTLFPTGKFKIEYDYNKPEGYEETDEAIRLGDALGSLQAIVESDKPK